MDLREPQEIARDARQQSRSFARWNQALRRSPNSNPRFLRLSAMISQYFVMLAATVTRNAG
jgi:hypothetical protein